MRHRIQNSLILCFFLIIRVSYSQNLTLIKSIPVSSVQAISIDVKNLFYVADEKGNVFQYDSTGKEINHYSPQRPGSVNLLDATKTMNIFIFYRDFQQYLILNRFLFGGDFSEFNADYIGYAYMTAPSLDNNLWIFDNLSFSLKKFDLKLQKVTFETPLELILDPNIYDVNFIREYQNKVYLNNYNQGILVFDNMGNHLETLPFKTNYFNFLNDEIYFIAGEKIVFFNLYNSQKREVSIKGQANVLYSLVVNQKIILFKKDEFLIFDLND